MLLSVLTSGILLCRMPALVFQPIQSHIIACSHSFLWCNQDIPVVGHCISCKLCIVNCVFRWLSTLDHPSRFSQTWHNYYYYYYTAGITPYVKRGAMIRRRRWSFLVVTQPSNSHYIISWIDLRRVDVLLNSNQSSLVNHYEPLCRLLGACDLPL